MSSSRTGSRGMLVSFDEPYYTNVYIIFGDEHVFVLDTFLGNESMKIVHHLIEDEGCVGMPVVVFNSHADYDHYWGNGAFKDALIVGHEHCYQRIISEGETSLVKHADHVRGKIELLPPTRTFQETLRFEDEGLTFFHTPGHTLDSSSCFDERDRVLFVGDNVESPIPYLNHANFDQYILSLESYLKLDWRVVIAGHDPPLKDSGLINRNIGYLRDFKNWNLDLGAMGKTEIHRHIQHNLDTIKSELLRGEHKEEVLKHLQEVEQYRH